MIELANKLIRENDMLHNFTTECNAGCHCHGVGLYPVCDAEGNPYYSPCHAGCRNANMSMFKDKNADMVIAPD
jgi:hypothetical protein